MAEQTLEITYNIYLEAEDISQSRIMSAASYVKELVNNHNNSYLNRAEFDDESNLDDFSFRLFAKETITEETCKNTEDAKAFIDDIVDLLFDIAHMHSFLNMEGDFSILYNGERKQYTFCSESGDSLCDFNEQ
ncbi:hypothetical protein I6E50_04930 [Roseburia hominis]|uniref:hypothetical protein n=1 Tax=Roseburia hominis TaxID=301301 RepID=UPI001F205189|nr:hypothetical protein [Roseburia hominis]